MRLTEVFGRSIEVLRLERSCGRLLRGWLFRFNPFAVLRGHNLGASPPDCLAGSWRLEWQVKCLLLLLRQSSLLLRRVLLFALSALAFAGLCIKLAHSALVTSLSLFLACLTYLLVSNHPTGFKLLALFLLSQPCSSFLFWLVRSALWVRQLREFIIILLCGLAKGDSLGPARGCERDLAPSIGRLHLERLMETIERDYSIMRDPIYRV